MTVYLPITKANPPSLHLSNLAELNKYLPTGLDLKESKLAVKKNSELKHYFSLPALSSFCLAFIGMCCISYLLLHNKT